MKLNFSPPIHLSVLLLAALWGNATFAWAYDGPRLSARQTEAIDKAVQREMKEQQVVGTAIGVIQNGQIAYLQGYGWSDAEKHLAVDERTMFRWASISKTLTAIGALQLAESAQLDLDANVRGYVPEFSEKEAIITCRQLLCHQSGIPHYSNGTIIKTQRVYTTPHPFEDVVTALDTFKESPLLFEPGSKFSYSTYAYMLLAAVVQRSGQKPFAEQIQERIALPLGMNTLQPDYQWLPIPDRAKGYTRKNNEVVPSTDTDVSWKLGGGGFISDVEDLALLAQGLLQKRLLKAETYEMAWHPQNTKDGDLTDWGLGFAVRIETNGQLKVWHDGAQEKARCRMVLYPHQKSGVVVMTNCEYGDPGRISTAIYSALNSKVPVN